MVLVIEAFELDQKTKIVYSHRKEIEIGNKDCLPLKMQSTLLSEVDTCIKEARRKQRSAAEFVKSVTNG